MIKDKPTLLETIGFIFYYSSAIIWPSFEFKDFLKFIKLEDEYSNIPWGKCNINCLWDFLLGFVCIFIKIYFVEFDTSYCGKEEFIHKPFIYKYFYMVVGMVRMRCLYYSGWKISQSSIIFCGLSYSKTEKGDSFDKVDICNLNKIELHLNPRVRIQYWNRSIHLWLKYYLFLRLVSIPRKPFADNKALASLITFMVSAIWHGFYPTYYLFFIEYYIIEQISTYLDEKYDFFTQVEQWNFLSKIFYRIFIMTVVNYFGLSFSLLSLRENLNYYRAFFYIPLIFLFGTYLWIILIGKKNKISIKRL